MASKRMPLLKAYCQFPCDILIDLFFLIFSHNINRPLNTGSKNNDSRDWSMDPHWMQYRQKHVVFFRWLLSITLNNNTEISDVVRSFKLLNLENMCRHKTLCPRARILISWEENFSQKYWVVYFIFIDFNVIQNNIYVPARFSHGLKVWVKKTFNPLTHTHSAARARAPRTHAHTHCWTYETENWVLNLPTGCLYFF